MKEIIPRPQSVIEDKKGGIYDISSVENLIIDKQFAKSSALIRKILSEGLSKTLGEDTQNAIKIKFSTKLAPQGYTIDISEGGIVINACDAEGALYAVQSLRVATMMGTKSYDSVIKCCKVNDYPKYGWRGLLIDEARHFFGEQNIKKLLDVMCMHKLNVLHWHLTDDQGWRVEIKKYPLLTEIGSKREKSQIHGWRKTDVNNTPHQGFYTQEQIKDIVAYADERGIMVVPEIDMPAHLAAAMSAYPWLGCRELKREVPYYFGGKIPESQGIKDWNRSACIGKPSTMQFIKDIIDEVCELFPAPYFHIGGDEAPKDEWKQCPACQAHMQKHGLKNEKQLQGWFINAVNEYVKEKGKNLIGWNEVLEGDILDKNVVVQYWTPKKDKKVLQHIKNGGKVIISKHKYFYFDMPYGMIPLRSTYMFNPFFEGFTPSCNNSIKGIEGTVWTEWIADFEKLEFQLYPRMEALAEVSWYGGPKNYWKFLFRLKTFRPMLDAMNINYAKESVYRPCNVFVRLSRMKKWFSSDEDVEYKENK